MRENYLGFVIAAVFLFAMLAVSLLLSGCGGGSSAKPELTIHQRLDSADTYLAKTDSRRELALAAGEITPQVDQQVQDMLADAKAILFEARALANDHDEDMAEDLRVQALAMIRHAGILVGQRIPK